MAKEVGVAVQSLIGVVDLSGENGERIGVLAQVLQDWEAQARLKTLPAGKPGESCFADEEEALAYAAGLNEMGMRAAVLLGVRVKERIFDLVYDFADGCYYEISDAAESEDHLTKVLLSFT